MPQPGYRRRQPGQQLVRANGASGSARLTVRPTFAQGQRISKKPLDSFGIETLTVRHDTSGMSIRVKLRLYMPPGSGLTRIDYPLSGDIVLDLPDSGGVTQDVVFRDLALGTIPNFEINADGDTFDADVIVRDASLNELLRANYPEVYVLDKPPLVPGIVVPVRAIWYWQSDFTFRLTNNASVYQSLTIHPHIVRPDGARTWLVPGSTGYQTVAVSAGTTGAWTYSYQPRLGGTHIAEMEAVLSGVDLGVIASVPFEVDAPPEVFDTPRIVRPFPPTARTYTIGESPSVIIEVTNIVGDGSALLSVFVLPPTGFDVWFREANVAVPEGRSILWLDPVDPSYPITQRGTHRVTASLFFRGYTVQAESTFEVV